jgi:hypothetical protein
MLNNAGYGLTAAFEEITEREFQRSDRRKLLAM